MAKERKKHVRLNKKEDGIAVEERKKAITEKQTGKTIILGNDKFPIENGRYGFLPEIEMF